MVNLLKLGNTLQALRPKRAFALEGVQYDSLNQITECQVVILRQRFHHLEQPLLNAYSGLYPLHHIVSRLIVILVHRYQYTSTAAKVQYARAGAACDSRQRHLTSNPILSLVYCRGAIAGIKEGLGVFSERLACSRSTAERVGQK